MLWEEGALPQSDVENLIEQTIRNENEKKDNKTNKSNLPDKTNSKISFKQIKDAIKRICERGEK